MMKAVERMKQSKFERFKAKLNLSLFDPYLDVQLNSDHKNRSNKNTFPTPSQFVSGIILGKSLERMKKEDGFDKALLKFYSNFAQGKISLSKDEFKTEYLAGKSLDQIAKTHHIPREEITFLKQLYCIKITGATYQKRILSTSVKKLEYGSVSVHVFLFSYYGHNSFKEKEIIFRWFSGGPVDGGLHPQGKPSRLSTIVRRRVRRLRLYAARVTVKDVLVIRKKSKTQGIKIQT